MRLLVLSGVNMAEGGILSIYRNVLDTCLKIEGIKIICLVHKKELFSDFLLNSNIEFLEFPNIKNSWFSRIKFEFYNSYFLSRKLRPDLWICLHDITANIYGCKQIVYCHNPSPFYQTKLKDLIFDKKFFLFTLLYKYLYKCNIRKNKFVIVQQKWIADFFINKFNINNLLVAKPVVNKNKKSSKSIVQEKQNEYFKLFYPAFPRVFKNFEMIIEALIILRSKNNKAFKKIKVFFTFDNIDNKYASHIYHKVKEEKIHNVVFMGLITQNEVFNFYDNHCDFLIFPSLLETWGLPLSEAKERNLPIICVDLPYAHETLDGYNKAIFFDKKSPDDLADLLSHAVENKINNYKVLKDVISSPTKNYQILNDWDDFRNFINDVIFKDTK